ncbi:glycoside hydrolase family 16 protein [Angustibacter peucedani]
MVLLALGSGFVWRVAAGPGDPRDIPGWNLVWADEFTGDALDPRRWKAEDHSTFGEGNGELACLMSRPSNVVLGDGVLRLRALRETPPLPCNAEDTRFPAGRDYSSAMLSTKGLASWTYGRFEIRAKLPTQAGTSAGLWPAFWLRPVDGGVGELDILEAIGSGAGSTESDAVHHTLWYDYSGTQRKQSTTATFPPGTSPSDGFHVYATEWDKGAIRFFVDGRLTFQRTVADTPWLGDAFSRPFFMRVNLAVGGSWPGAPTATTLLPADYAVDYVRVYQR